jgi:hypothetical protein
MHREYDECEYGDTFFSSESIHAKQFMSKVDYISQAAPTPAVLAGLEPQEYNFSLSANRIRSSVRGRKEGE